MPPKKKPIEVSSPTELLTPLNIELTEENKTDIRRACEKAGIGIEEYCLAIADALKANRSLITKDGSVWEEADHDKRLKAAMMGLELEGHIKTKGSTTDNSKHTHVTYAWLTAQPVVTQRLP